MRLNNAINKFIVAILFLIPQICFADNKGKKLDINSDQLIINYEELSTIFQGNVIVSFGEYKLKTDQLVVRYTKDRKIENILIPNKLFVFKNCNDEFAIANRGSYDKTSGELVLDGGVMIKKEGHIMKSEKIIYHVKL